MIYIASFLLIGWGIAHLIFTSPVVRGFGDISIENKRVITMEWITEGVALVFIGVLVGWITYLDRTSPAATLVYCCSIVVLNILSAVSLLTGARNKFIVYKLCPVIFTGSSVLIAIGSMR